MTDPIKAALEAAETALHGTVDYQPENDRMPPEMQREVIANPQEVVAAVCAAFLRRVSMSNFRLLPPDYRIGLRDTEPLNDALHIAAVVEAATRDD